MDNNEATSPCGLKQTTGLRRNTIDKYYTKPPIANMCVDYIRQHVTIGPDDIVIEPSAGNGSFILGIQSLTRNYRLYDLEPAHAEIIQQDYLKLDITTITNKIHIIGNPPFGRQSSMAIKFIKKSCAFCDSVSFILPKSFKKDSLKKTFPLRFHLVFETDLPDKSFLVDGTEYTVPSVFQIWVKRENERPTTAVLEPSNFVFVNKTANPDISFRRVGVNAGTIDTNIDEKSVQSHYFIRFTNGKSVDENIRALSNIIYDFNNTVGPRSISKQELIKEFNEIL